MVFNPFKGESVFKQVDKLVFYKSKVRPEHHLKNRDISIILSIHFVFSLVCKDYSKSQNDS